MFDTMASALKRLETESANTQKIFQALTDEALSQAVNSNHRTLGRMAWHIVNTIPEMMNNLQLGLSSVNENDPVPEHAIEIQEAYKRVSTELLGVLTDQWTDETLRQEDDLYGESWKRGETLLILVLHEVHHRGQMTVLMRQAGLRVPGVYGPSREDWASHGMPVPEV